ncbi:hypothetical protein [Geminocystis sp. GBBB08]|uniref:hypothetical protein n=1 Tax=Geminocystis sp. GBBB08 TaxID=2604140 RepID=UPI0027E31DBE|nr:hypothetical protein [Geminocystis sp. GBBB08]MBL1209468.1 hypothetical protein [Geminocystis sp. GBBB08]
MSNKSNPSFVFILGTKVMNAIAESLPDGDYQITTLPDHKFEVKLSWRIKSLSCESIKDYKKEEINIHR